MSERTDDPHRPKPAHLARIMELGLAAGEPWRPEELRTVLEYELAAPMSFDLGSLDAKQAVRLKVVSAAEGLLLKSLRDLLQHPQPPLELLRFTKDFAKANSEDKNSSLPKDVALVIYYTSIAAALVRCQARITQLTVQELRQGFDWALSLPWLDEASRALLAEARQQLGGNHSSMAQTR